MGANYDAVIAPAIPAGTLEARIESFLRTRGFAVAEARDLRSADINDDNVVLFSHASKQWMEIITSCTALNSDYTSWYHCNPLASYLSIESGPCVYLWSLDSGYVAGYSIYDGSRKVESDWIFARHAGNKCEIMQGVAAPPKQKGQFLSRLLNGEYEFAEEMPRWKNPEIGMAKLIALFGFDAHLVDLHDALEDKRGVAIRGEAYEHVPLHGWRALPFIRAG